MDRKFYLDLAKSGLRMPIGADLTLKEKNDHEKILLEGKMLGDVVIETAKKYKTPLAFPLMDLTVEKEWMLSFLGVPAADAGVFHFHAPPTEEEAGKIREGIEKGATTDRIKANCDALAHVAKASGLVSVGMAIGPFSLMTKFISDPITGVYLSGAGTSAADDDEVRMIETVLDLATDAVLKSIRLQVEAGAKAICLCEPAANTVFFSPIQLESGSDVFDRYVMNYNKKARALLAKYGADLIFHDCGELLDSMVTKFNELDPAVLSLGSSRTLWEDARLVSKNTVLFGNLPTKRFYSDRDVSLADVENITKELSRKMAAEDHPFIVGSECDVLFVPGASGTINEKIDRMLHCAV